MARRPTFPIGRDAESVGTRLMLVREALGLTGIFFAEKAGIAPSSYSQYEGGKRRCSLESAIALSDAYQLSLDWIFLGDHSALRPKLVDTMTHILELRANAPVS
jgi:transcriptional regulator with XRE-family HTH domain